MHRVRLILQIYPSYLILTVMSVFAISCYTTTAIQQFFLEQSRTELQTQALFLKQQISALLTPVDEPAIDRLCKQLTKDTRTRLTVILSDGKVIGDSMEHPEEMDNHRNRSEVMKALKAEPAFSIRYSNTVRERFVYYAHPIIHEGKVIAALRTSMLLSLIDERKKMVQMKIVVAGILIAMTASLICYYISKKISRPIEEMKESADRFAEGDLYHRVQSSNTLELNALAQAMNDMAFELQQRLRAIRSQRNELDSVLSSMIEGVIAIDNEERIIKSNPAAGIMLGCLPIRMQGRSVQEIIRNKQLQEYIEETLKNNLNVNGDVILFQKKERILNVQCTPLRDARKKRFGILVVLNDVTALRRLETMRQDFVANVSHEIRTPLTAIQGFVETLLEGNIDNPEDRQRYLEIVNKHVVRLNTMVEDLLSLARLEEDEEIDPINFERKPLRKIFKTVLQVVQSKSQSKKIVFAVKCPRNIVIDVDTTLFEQAIINIVDNAIKYSSEGGVIEMDGTSRNDFAVIRIRDHGTGIPKNHLPRLFERFYRVDKARSRKLGGSGLGLAIVKHIVKAHYGAISVDSTPGKGTVFYIKVPLHHVTAGRIECTPALMN